MTVRDPPPPPPASAVPPLREQPVSRIARLAQPARARLALLIRRLPCWSPFRPSAGRKSRSSAAARSYTPRGRHERPVDSVGSRIALAGTSGLPGASRCRRCGMIVWITLLAIIVIALVLGLL